MTLRAPNIALFVIAFCLAMVGVLAAEPIAVVMPGVSPAWFVFLAWFVLAAGCVLPLASGRDRAAATANAQPAAETSQ